MNFATALLVLSMVTHFARDANATKKSKVCGMKNWPACALGQVDIVTSNYSILATNLSSEDEEISFSVRVYHTECPTAHHLNQTLKWYRLEALLVSTNASTRVGTFLEPFESRRLETYACQNNSIIVFATCEPHPLDLPRLYQWTIPRLVNITMDDVLCFRLTIQDTYADEQCKFTEVCIPMKNMTEEMASGSGEIRPDSGRGEMTSSQIGSGAFGASSNHTERCYERIDCSNARMKLFCGSDGNEYASRCHIRLQECITETEIRIEHPGPCEEEHEKVCSKQRDILKMVEANWLPTCDCDELFKAKQCNRDRTDSEQLECWCSYSNSISEVVNTRRRIIDICSDPATFDFSCPSRWT